MARSVVTPREERIRRRAQEIYEKRKAAGEGSSGDALSDWLEAEKEISAEEETKSV